MQISSPAFEQNGSIPSRHTCDGKDLSPPLAWSDLPDGIKALALLVDDPDVPDPAAPKRVWVHWIAYNIPPAPSSLPEGTGNRPPAGPMRFAITDSGQPGYHGPCPPVGRHRYFFHLFALDAHLPDLGPRAGRAEFEAAMSPHIMGTAVLVGTYARPGNG
jgi:Raf kinase inhibitor-like YbhB/YbcL family protein